MGHATNLWKPEYLLDIEVIDQQHKRFLDMCCEVASLVDVAAAGAPLTVGHVLRVVFQLRSYAFTHFGTEEELFVKYAYPGMFEHFRLHDEYIVRTRLLFDSLLASRPRPETPADQAFMDTIRGLTDFMQEWWGEHILVQDSQYAAHVKARRREGAERG